MTFPQPSSLTAMGDPTVDYFRIRTQLQSSGDLFESEVGLQAVCLGPDSDIGCVQVTYWDPLPRYYLDASGLPQPELSKVSTVRITQDRMWTGLIPARMEQEYPQQPGRKGRILFSLVDIFRPDWLDETAGETAVYYREPVFIDIIQYFQPPPPGLTPTRDDRFYRYQYYMQSDGVQPSFVVMPAYGRKSGFITFLNRRGSGIDVDVIGVNLSTSGPPGPNGNRQETLFSATVANNATAAYSFVATTEGTFDFLVLALADVDQGDEVAITVQLSDDPL